MREKPLLPWLIAEKSGKDLVARCDCMAGLGEACFQKNLGKPAGQICLETYPDMAHADASVVGECTVSLRTSRNQVERKVPFIRLGSDADLKEMYNFGIKLGQGSYGVVHEVTHLKTQTKWAIKEVCRPVAGSSKVKMVDNEINLLTQVNHTNIIHLQEVYYTAKMTYLVTELCSGGELKQLLKRKTFFTEDETRHIINSLADAVVYLHKKNIIHRDLKLENILVKHSDEDDNGRIKIKVTDFGLSVQTRGVGIESIMTEACGTLIYMAPEMLSGRGYGQWCDVWSIGIIMYMLLCGEPPFRSRSREQLLKEIMKGIIKFKQPIWATVSNGAKTLLTCLLKADPAYRMSANQLLENPWITGDTTLPLIPSNVLDMMRHQLEQEERSQTLEYLSLHSPGVTPDHSLVARVLSLDSASKCRRKAELRPKREVNFCPPSESTKSLGMKSKMISHHLNQTKCKKLSETPGPPHPTTTTTTTTTTQSHACAKPSKQPSAKQAVPPDKKQGSTGQKPASDIRRCSSQRPSTSSKKTDQGKASTSSKTKTPLT